eukprot:gene75-475_t
MSGSKLDYLQKYLKPGGATISDGLRVRKDTLEKKSKKKRKKNLEQAGGFLVRDDDDMLPAAGVGAKTRKKKRRVADSDDEDAPQIVDAIPVDVEISGGTWAVSKSEAAGSTVKREAKRERHDSDDDMSPPRGKARHDSDDDLSPARGRASKRHDSDDDDLSPPRKQVKKERHDSDDDISPPRNKATRHDSDDDMSPPRKQVKKERHDSDDEDLSPPRGRAARHDSDDEDLSPPRNKATRHDSDEDLSPPRKQVKKERHDSDDDMSPPRGRPARRDSDDDLSPPRGTPARHDSDSDLSPARGAVKKERRDSDSEEDEKEKKRKRKEEKKKRKEQKAEEKMSSGMSSGLVQGSKIAEQIAANKIKRLEELKKQSAEETGQGAKTVYRQKGGAQVDKSTYAEQNQRKVRKEWKKQDVTWGGEKNAESYEEEQARLQKLAEGPFARHDIDADYNQELKDKLRMDDPMAKEMMERKEREERARQNRPKCRHPMPPNRFNIEPGYRWDGKIRGIGWEQKWIQRRTKAQRDKNASYSSAIADMSHFEPTLGGSLTGTSRRRNVHCLPTALNNG